MENRIFEINPYKSSLYIIVYLTLYYKIEFGK